MFVFWILFDVVWVDFSCGFVPFFLFCFRLLLAPPCLVLLKISFREAPSLLATCTCCFALQTEATHLTVVVEKKRAYGHTTSLFVMAHRNVGLSSSCMLDLLRMSFSCTAAVLFLVQIEHLYSGPSFSLCCPPPIAPSPDRTRPPAQLSTHFCSKTQMIMSTQTREDWTCFAQ